jgi:hypothetical protein
MTPDELPREATAPVTAAGDEAMDGTTRAAEEGPSDGSWRWWTAVRERVRAKKEAIFLAVDDKTTFPESEDDLRAKLATDDAEMAADLLSEAEHAHDRLRERIDGAERRATTLQGSSAIAASLTLTAAGLLIDPAKLRGWVWQVLFGLTIIYITFALVMCAWRATLASSRVHRWVAPPDRDILDRVEQGIAAARVDRAVALLHVIGGNQRFARYKVAMMRGATEWIVRALVALLVLALLATTYALFGPEPQQAKEVTPTGSTP